MGRNRRIKTKPDRPEDTIQLGGWLQGKQTYFWFGKDGKCIGTLSGQKLYRLACAIVDQFDMDKR